jgi:hypothetical protein
MKPTCSALGGALISRPSTGRPGPAPCAARRRCSAPSAGWKPYGLPRVNPAPGGGESGGRNRCRSPPPGTPQAGQPHYPRLGDRPTVSTTQPPRAQKPWACTRSQLFRPARRCEIRGSFEIVGVDVRMIQSVDRVKRVRRRQPKPARRTGRERVAGPGARRRPGSIPSSWSSTGRAS